MLKAVPGTKVFYQEERKRLMGWQVLEVQSGGNCRGAHVWKRLKPTVKRAPEVGVCNRAGCIEDETPAWPESYFYFLSKVGCAAVAKKGMLNLLSLESKQNIMPEQTWILCSVLALLRAILSFE